ncbi:probable protein phosphatase 2C 66 isoform X2 [Jatropha curcas]|uniref:probable protein phosphatase 2C 66 isoform X2 n=1 Tax=Jatropha curcas TaxID=180498 RepID=UPI0009D6DBD0|nr:probable protein phosphatase 2C 66 isoform X2 [Jatropha curcas]
MVKGKRGRDDSGEVEETNAASAASPKRHRWKKKSTGGGSGGDESLLNHIPGRMARNGASNIACLYTQQGKKGTNQDAMLVWENFLARSDTVFCGVFDGHGPFGHMVAKKVRDSLPLILCTQWEDGSNENQTSLHKSGNTLGRTNSEEAASASMDDESHDSLEVEQNEKLPENCLPLKKSLLKAFKLMDKELKMHPTIDCFCSGSTSVTLIKQGQDLVIGNLGDSRAVLATRDEDNSLLAVQLTVDLKPDLPREAARIQQCKGRVFALKDEPEVARVWLPNNDSPGLAMARAFGDFCLKDFGLISIPDIYYRHLTKQDEFIILATDGVWDVLSNKEAVDIVASAPSRATAARALVDCAVRAWRLKYPTSKNDDCAVVCLFLEHLSEANGEVESDLKKIPNEPVESVMKSNETVGELETHDDSHAYVLSHSDTIRGSDEIVPVSELTEEKLSLKSQSQSKRSLAECISTAEDEEWTALEGITRVNSLLSIPRLLSGDRRTTSWRKWL